MEEVDVKNRYEIRLHSEKAQKFIEFYLEDTYLLRSARSVISQQLCFLKKKKWRFANLVKMATVCRCN